MSNTQQNLWGKGPVRDIKGKGASRLHKKSTDAKTLLLTLVLRETHPRIGIFLDHTLTAKSCLSLKDVLILIVFITHWSLNL